MSVVDATRSAFVQVVAGAACSSWVEVVRAGMLPPDLVAATRTTRGTLDTLLDWMRAEHLPDVRGAMQAVRLGAPCRHASVAYAGAPADAPPLRLEVSGGEWHAGLWAYVLRVESDAPASHPAPAVGHALAYAPDPETGVVEYAHPSFNVRLDAVAHRLHGLSESPERDISVIGWAGCFEGEDQIGAISALCWPVSSELPKRLSLRLAHTAHGPPRRLEFVVQAGVRSGAVRASCRLLPASL
jgi:hypothetical protein